MYEKPDGIVPAENCYLFCQSLDLLTISYFHSHDLVTEAAERNLIQIEVKSMCATFVLIDTFFQLKKALLYATNDTYLSTSKLPQV